MSVASSAPMRARLTADFLFVIQAICALTLGVAQLRRMLHSVDGVSITWMLFWVAFLAVNLGLALRAHRAFASRISRQTIAIYALWTAVCGANLLFLLGAPAARWTVVDTDTASLTVGRRHLHRRLHCGTYHHLHATRAGLALDPRSGLGSQSPRHRHRRSGQ